MKKNFKYLLILLAILIGSVTVFIKLFDFNDYKPQIERLIRKYADIDVKINGDLYVAISLRPTIEINDVVVTLPDGTKVANINSAAVQFAIEPLLHKELELDLVETNDTEIFYDENESFIIHDLTVDIEGPDDPVMVEVATTISGIAFEAKGTISTWEELQQNQFNNIDVDAEIKALGCKMLFKGALNNLQDNMSATGNYNLTYKNNEINGELEVSLAEEVPYIKLKANGDKIDVEALTQTAHNDYFDWIIAKAYAEEYIVGTTIPYSYLQMFNADVSLDLKKIIVDKDLMINNVISDINIRNGKFKANIKQADVKKLRISGNVSLDSPKSLPYIKLDVKGNTIDLQKLTADTSSKKHSSLNIKWLIKEAQATSFMPNTPIPYQYLRKVNGEAKLNLQKIIVIPEVVLEGIQTNFTLKNGELKTNIKNITAGRGKISGTIDVDAKNQKLMANIEGQNIVLQDLYTLWGKADNKDLYIKKGGLTNALIKVETKGLNTDAYLKNLNGQIILLMDKSTMHVKSLQRLQGNIIVQILQNLKLNVTNKKMHLNCAVLRSDIENGRLNFPKGIAFDATDLYLVADGHVSLSTEKINLSIQSFSGKISDISISSILGAFLKIRGTISQPELSVNKDTTAKSVIGVITTGGVYNVGDMMLSADHAPCHTALAETKYADHFEADTSVRNSVSQGYNNTQNQVKSVVKNLKKNTKKLKNSIKGLFQ